MMTFIHYYLKSASVSFHIIIGSRWEYFFCAFLLLADKETSFPALPRVSVAGPAFNFLIPFSHLLTPLLSIPTLPIYSHLFHLSDPLYPSHLSHPLHPLHPFHPCPPFPLLPQPSLSTLL